MLCAENAVAVRALEAKIFFPAQGALCHGIHTRLSDLNGSAIVISVFLVAVTDILFYEANA